MEENIKKAAIEMTAQEAYMVSPLAVPKITATSERGEKLAQAIDKIEGMKVVAGVNSEYFCVPLLNYLARRIEESEEILDALLLNHKSWTRLWGFVSKKIRDSQKMGSSGSMQCVALESSQIFTLVDSYLLKDDKKEVEEEEKKRREEAEKRKKSSSVPKKEKEKEKKAEKTKKPEKPAEPSLFDLDIFDDDNSKDDPDDESRDESDDESADEPDDESKNEPDDESDVWI